MSDRNSGGDLELPLTPLIDCTFLLIIFFLLTAQLAGRELPELVLPDPQKTTSAELPADVKHRNHVTVNVLNQYGDTTREREMERAGVASWYQVGVDRIEVGRAGALNSLERILDSRKAQADNHEVSDFWVEVRADRDIRYGDVQPVMEAASDAGIAMMSLTVAGEEKGQKDTTEER